MRLIQNKLKTEAKWTRKSEFIDEVGLVMRWGASLDAYTQFSLRAGSCSHIVQKWSNLSDPAMEEALYDTPMFRDFLGLDAGKKTCPMRAQHFGFATCSKPTTCGMQILSTVNATLAANVNDVTQAAALVYGEETEVLADAGYQGLDMRAETQGIDGNWLVAMRPSKRKALGNGTPMGAILDKLEQAKARIPAKVEYPFRTIKRQFGHLKVRYRGLAKNKAQLHTLFALSNLWMERRTLLQEMRT